MRLTMSADRAPTPTAIFDSILKNLIRVEEMISDCSIPNDTVTAEMTRAFVKATAVDDKFENAATCLIHADAVTRHFKPDFLDSVPGVRPVCVTSKDVLDETGNPMGETIDKMPFNLTVLCEHLTNVSLFQRILPEDQITASCY